METRVDEIAADLYRISIYIAKADLQFNQFLVLDDEPLLYHTGMRRMFPQVSKAVAGIMDPARLRWIGFSHFEADECGSLDEWLAVAPHASPLCGAVAALVSIRDLADRPPRALADGETLSLGKHSMRWFDTPHLPHAWECGYLMEEKTGTLLCGDLFTRTGNGAAIVHDGQRRAVLDWTRRRLRLDAPFRRRELIVNSSIFSRDS